jgi:hypothetical protein
MDEGQRQGSFGREIGMLYCEGVNVNQRGNITKIYERLLSSNYSKYETALDLFRLVRDSFIIE